MLFPAKLYATSVSLGSGASGGIFSPSLFVGAAIGGAFGGLAATPSPLAGVTVTTGVGMAALCGGGTSAAVTAVIHDLRHDARLPTRA